MSKKWCFWARDVCMMYARSMLGVCTQIEWNVDGRSQQQPINCLSAPYQVPIGVAGSVSVMALWPWPQHAAMPANKRLDVVLGPGPKGQECLTRIGQTAKSKKTIAGCRSMHRNAIWFGCLADENLTSVIVICRLSTSCALTVNDFSQRE